jgi:DNA-binding winged helix-turn-helix (wHTH) protein
VTVVAGPVGSGKTALVRAALAEERDTTLCVSASSVEPSEQTTVEVARALSSVLGSPVDLAELQREHDALIDATLDLGARWGGVVVVDGLATHEEHAQSWLAELAEHAEEVCFVICGRALPARAELAGQVLPLGSLDAPAMRALAEAWAPQSTVPARLAAIRRSGGRPGQLLAALQGSEATTAPTEQAHRLLRLLAASGQAMSASLLDCIGSAETREELQAFGLLRAVGDGYEPWDADVGRPPPEELEAAAVPLALRGEVDATLAAVGLLARAGATHRVAAILEERGEGLLREGYAARLWRALGDLPNEELEGWQLRCAAQLGNPTALARAHEPTHDAPEDRLLWAATLLARGKVIEAESVATALAEEPGPSSVDAACVAAEAAARAGKLETATAILAKAEEPGDEGERLALEIARMRWTIERGQGGADWGLAEYVRALDRADASERTWRTLAETFERRGDLDAVLETLDTMDARPRGARPELLASRMSLVIRARVAVERGEPTVAHQLLDVVRPFAREPSALAAPIAACELRARFLEGRLDGFDEQLALSFARCRERDALTHRRLVELRERLAGSRGDPPRHAAMTPAGIARRARWAEPITDAAPASADRRTDVWHLLAKAGSALAAGRGTDALLEAQRAVDSADRWSLTELALEARAVCAEALVVVGDLRGLRALAAELAESARRSGSLRFERAARFFGAVARGRLDPATAELLASGLLVSPTVARWSRVVLGGDAQLDTADRVLLEALRVAGAVGATVRHDRTSDGWSRAWGIDLTERSAWLPNGERVSLGSRPTQWRILEILARSPGLSASKEAIVCGGWDVGEYHPGRHDGRLYVAIRKLRMVLEDDPSAPQRLVTTDEGYALGEPVRLVDCADDGKG